MEKGWIKVDVGQVQLWENKEEGGGQLYVSKWLVITLTEPHYFCFVMSLFYVCVGKPKWWQLETGLCVHLQSEPVYVCEYMHICPSEILVQSCY